MSISAPIPVFALIVLGLGVMVALKLSGKRPKRRGRGRRNTMTRGASQRFVRLVEPTKSSRRKKEDSQIIKTLESTGETSMVLPDKNANKGIPRKAIKDQRKRAEARRRKQNPHS